jgi:hypothetical protein
MIRKTLLAASVAAMTAAPCLAGEVAVKMPDPQPVVQVQQTAPKIQLAILLDTSNSMDGLINQTREQLWKIVNTFTTAQRDGKRPVLELALYEYGNDGLPAAEHYVRRVVPLTTELDRVSEALFGLRTNGGSEFCGAAISHATGELEWSTHPADLRLMYIAGNEPFSQGPIAFRQAIRSAQSKGIVVNTIHAGTEEEGISGGWREGAMLAQGNFLFIDSQRTVARVAAPQDAELAKLSQELNQTYVGYGAKGEESAARQVAQDKNAAGMSASSLSTRAAAKASSLYRNTEWDLVDAQKDEKSLGAMPATALPSPMRAMNAKERADYVAEKRKARTEIQQRITTLSREREAYVQSELKKQTKGSTQTMDEALIDSAKGQAKRAAFTF